MASASLSCRRALGGASASVSGRARQLVSRSCAGRPAQPAAPCALLRVRDDLREPGVVSWVQARGGFSLPAALSG